MNERKESHTGHARMHVNNEATMGSEWQREWQTESGREGGSWNVYCNFYFHHLMHSLWQAALSLWLAWQHVANYEWMSAKSAITGGGRVAPSCWWLPLAACVIGTYACHADSHQQLCFAVRQMQELSSSICPTVTSPDTSQCFINNLLWGHSVRLSVALHNWVSVG